MISATVVWLVSVSEIWEFYLFAFVFGVLGGGLTSLYAPLVAELFGLKSHGSVFGVSNLGTTLGGSIGPFLTGYIFDLTGRYQPAFITITALVIAGLISTTLIKPVNAESTK